MCPRQTIPSRRAFLAASATTVLTATAGCTAVFDIIGEQFLEDVNVFTPAQISPAPLNSEFGQSATDWLSSWE